MNGEPFAARPLSLGPSFYAHTPPPDEPERWHAWADHALGVGNMAGESGEAFGARDLLRLIGYTHDAGKLTSEVQLALRARAVDHRPLLGVPHKHEGAALGALLLEVGQQTAAIVMSLVNFGHHHQLPNFKCEPSQLLEQMRTVPDHLDDLVEQMDQLLGLSLRDLAAQVRMPEYLDGPPTNELRRRVELFARMCHSALVDADFLDTSAHFHPGEPIASTSRGMESLREAFMLDHGVRFKDVMKSDLNELRREIFDSCVRVGVDPDAAAARGIYRLPAQTGSGKTMAAAAFALSHAAEFAKRRVIVAVPFTSITTQNAAVCRDAFTSLGADVVLEHHSNIGDDDIHEDPWRRLSAANWDAEFIVTTTVQLFESLFAANPKATRKLHRLAESVIVLDEVQALPLPLLPAILDMLGELVEYFGVTVLLASATQPSFWDLPIWQERVAPIDIADVSSVPDVTRRVRYETRTHEQSWSDIADETAALEQALVIVNKTQTAQDLLALLDERVSPEDCFHLSTRMCNSHRLAVLEEVRRRLHLGEPVRLVSTQLIEAGVDVDFPVVFRLLAPADAIVQSAGRCNREGKLGHEGGRVVVFRIAGEKPLGGDYGVRTNVTLYQFLLPGSTAAFDDPVALGEYYSETYRKLLASDARTKSVEIDITRSQLDFPATHDKFQMIDQHSTSVLVLDHGSERDRADLQALKARLEGDPAAVLTHRERRLVQGHSASVPRSQVRSGLVMRLAADILVWAGEYDPRAGVVLHDSGSIW